MLERRKKNCSAVTVLGRAEVLLLFICHNLHRSRFPPFCSWLLVTHRDNRRLILFHTSETLNKSQKVAFFFSFDRSFFISRAAVFFAFLLPFPLSLCYIFNITH